MFDCSPATSEYAKKFKKTFFSFFLSVKVNDNLNFKMDVMASITHKCRFVHKFLFHCFTKRITGNKSELCENSLTQDR